MNAATTPDPSPDLVVAHVRAVAGNALTHTYATKARKATLVASSPWITADLAQELATHADAGVREHLARNKHTPLEALTPLMVDPVDRVRTYATSNPNVPYETALAHAPSGFDALAHPNCPAEVLTQTLHDTLPQPTRLTTSTSTKLDAVMLHPNLPDTARKSLLLLPVPWTSTLLRNPHTTQAEADTIFDRIKARPYDLHLSSRWWAEHPNATSTWLAHAATRVLNEPSNRLMIGALAAHPSTPLELAFALAEHYPSAAGRNPNATPELLHRILDNAQATQLAPSAAGLIAHNPAADLTVLSRLHRQHSLGGVLLYQFLTTHAARTDPLVTSAAQVDVITRLARTWTATIADLLITSAAISSDAPEVSAGDSTPS